MWGQEGGAGSARGRARRMRAGAILHAYLMMVDVGSTRRAQPSGGSSQDPGGRPAASLRRVRRPKRASSSPSWLLLRFFRSLSPSTTSISSLNGIPRTLRPRVLNSLVRKARRAAATSEQSSISSPSRRSRPRSSPSLLRFHELREIARIFREALYAMFLLSHGLPADPWTSLQILGGGIGRWARTSSKSTSPIDWKLCEEDPAYLCGFLT